MIWTNLKNLQQCKKFKLSFRNSLAMVFLINFFISSRVSGFYSNRPGSVVKPEAQSWKNCLRLLTHRKSSYCNFMFKIFSTYSEYGDENQNSQTESRFKGIRNPLERDVLEIASKMKRFYNAYERRDMSVLENIWSKSDAAKLIIPESGVLSGFNSVMTNMNRLLYPETGEGEVSNKEIYPSDFSIKLRGNTAWVTSIEETKGKTQSPLGAMPMNFPKMRVTTLFRRESGEWRILLRQASQLSPIQIKTLTPEGRPPAGSIIISAADSVEEVVDEDEVMSVVSALKEKLNKSQPSRLNEAGGPKISLLAYNPSTGKHELNEIVGEKEQKEVLNSGKNQSKKKLSSKEETMTLQDDEEDPKVLMIRTVEALRQLCDEERISVDQKRVLLADVIRHGNKENASLVEMAYCLLTEGLSESEAYEEFADQCRIFADQLLSKANL